MRCCTVSILVILGLTACEAEPSTVTRKVDGSARVEAAFDTDLISIGSEIYSASSDTLLEGVEVCDETSGRCVETSSDGEFVLDGLEPQTETVLTFRLAGYRPALIAFVTPRFSTKLPLGTQLVPFDTERERATDVQRLLREAGRPEIDLSPERLDSVAQIEFGAANEFGWAFDRSVSATLDPPSGEGPMFFTFPGRKTALELTNEDLAFAAAFMNVEPREEGYEIVYSRESGASCVFYDGAYGGWPSRSGRSNAHHVPTRAGYYTFYTQAFCPSGMSAPPTPSD